MDINYLLKREQVSLHSADIAASSTARIAHSGLAAAYRALLTDAGFPHRQKSDEPGAALDGPGI